MYRVGVDLGGTNIAVGVVDDNFNIIGRGKMKTNAPRDAKAIFDDIATAVKMAVADANLRLYDIASIGIGTPAAPTILPSISAIISLLGLHTGLGRLRDASLRLSLSISSASSLTG